MAIPKKRMSTTRSGNRRSQIGLNRPATTVCPHCQAVIRPHNACSKCGYYKGVKVS